MDVRYGPCTKVVSSFAAPRTVREALSALTLMKAGGSGEVGSKEGSGIFAAFHSSCNVASDEVRRLASWVS